MYVIGYGRPSIQGYDISVILIKAGLGLTGLLMVLSTVTTFLDAYSAGVSSVSISSAIRKNGGSGSDGSGYRGCPIPVDNITGFLYRGCSPMIAIR